MKTTVAIVRPERPAEVLAALFLAEVRGFTVGRVEGHGGELAGVQMYQGTTVKTQLPEKFRLEIAVSDHFVELTVKAMLDSARTGRVGDGKVFVLPVEQAYRICNGDEDRAAVTPVESIP